jgi:ABC-2 type transport system ATP-binding protein
MPPPAVHADALHKHYPGSPAPALDGFDLTVPPGTVHGCSGPTARARPPPCAS